MTGREWQWGLFLSDRWRVSQNLTLNLGVRVEAYPLMTRADRGLERLEYDTYTVLIGGLGDVPEDVGLDVQTWYFSPRVGAAYRVGDKSVIRGGYSQTFNALPWSRPLRGSFPQNINFNRAAEQFRWTTTLAAGIPPVQIPDISSGRVTLPRGVFMRSPNIGIEYFPGSGSGLDRATIHQYNITFERELPFNLVTAFSYVGTRTNGGYADLNLNYGEPGGGETARKYYAVAGTSSSRREVPKAAPTPRAPAGSRSACESPSSHSSPKAGGALPAGPIKPRFDQSTTVSAINRTPLRHQLNNFEDKVIDETTDSD